MFQVSIGGGSVNNFSETLLEMVVGVNVASKLTGQRSVNFWGGRLNGADSDHVEGAGGGRFKLNPEFGFRHLVTGRA